MNRQRLIGSLECEAGMLSDRITGFEFVVESPDFIDTEEPERTFMIRQLRAMKDYRKILRLRISHLKKHEEVEG